VLQDEPVLLPESGKMVVHETPAMVVELAEPQLAGVFENEGDVARKARADGGAVSVFSRGDMAAADKSSSRSKSADTTLWHSSCRAEIDIAEPKSESVSTYNGVDARDQTLLAVRYALLLRGESAREPPGVGKPGMCVWV